MAKLTTSQRKNIPKKDFAAPSSRSKSGGSGGYPIPDKNHAINALSRVTAFGSPSLKAKVRAAVNKKYPELKNRARQRAKGK